MRGITKAFMLIIFLILSYLVARISLSFSESSWTKKSQSGFFSVDDWNRGIFETPFDNSSSRTVYEFAKPSWNVGDFFEIAWTIQARSLGSGGETARLRQGIVSSNGRIEVQAQISVSENIEGWSCHYYITYHASNRSSSGTPELRDPRTVYDNAIIFDSKSSYKSDAPLPLLIQIRISRTDSNTVSTSVSWGLVTGSFNVFDRVFSTDWSQVSWQVDVGESAWGQGGACSVQLVSYYDSFSTSKA